MDPDARLRETDHGRSEGWDVSLDGEVVALLDEPAYEEMFWVSYRIVPCTHDPELAARLLSDEYWSRHFQDLCFRSRALGLAASHAFPAREFVAPGRVNMRGLYLTEEDLKQGPVRAADPDSTLVDAPVERSWWSRMLAGLGLRR